MIVDVAVSAFKLFLDPTILLFVLFGTVMGLAFGALPGLGGATAIALLIPLTFNMDPFLAFAVMVSAQGGATFGGSLSAILINVPGTAPNAATILDGHPLAKQGKANVAIGASAASSAIGALVGVAFLVVSLPVVRPMLRLFGSPEFFLMAVFGLVVLAVVTRGPLINGLIAGGLGLMLSFVGQNPVVGGIRYTYDLPYLLDGVPLIPVIIGVFAIGELLRLLAEDRSITHEAAESGGSIIAGIKEVFGHPVLLIKSSLIGTFIGLVPAVGGTVANFVSYMNASQSAENNEKFGKGDIRGLIASESANDAKDGGAMIPTIAFGIPGSAVWAVILGALIVHGLVPGPRLLDENLDLIFVMIFALIISNLVTSLIGISIAGQISRITTMDVGVIAPPIILVSLLGAYIVRLLFADVVLAAVFGVLGYLMIQYSISRVSLLIGIVLGPIAETSYAQSMQLSDGSWGIFVSDIVSIVLVVSIVLALLYAVSDLVSDWKHLLTDR
ncbi:tripartite tricarboxylate transporter permease [Salinigranum marinum]|uniref:tripartite tricarboxylate transporter permease n=1 Tax=Salinigranum marinum TaxID=1515595 RepID=UPI002989AB07|nr:tripartite tricarboxylate transporter permease [Salinigranum marinum]